MKNYGLKLEELKEGDYVFGANLLGDSPINPSGQWDGWLPEYEPQSRPGSFDSYACVTFATLNCVEILELHEFGTRNNWSDRYLAKTSGTDKIRGNTPAVVAETLKAKGCVKEQDYPFDIFINTFDLFYREISEAIHTLAVAFKAEYAFGYEHVPSTARAIKEALTYSPVLFTVAAWYKDENGLYYRPQGETDNHAVICYGYEDGQYWKILDSYADDEGSYLKKVRWDSLPMVCKRYTLHRNINNETAWTKFLAILRSILGL